MTSKGTFQKFYEQDEFASWVESVLQMDVIVGAPGLLYVFKEKKYLDHYSMNNEFLDDEELTTTKSVADQGETWVFNEMEGIPSMEFKYESTEENVDEILHSGYLTVNKDEFYGEIYCDTEGTYSLCNFESAEGENVFEKYEGLEHEIGTFLSIVCNDLKTDLKS